jgi:hypothetical protein
VTNGRFPVVGASVQFACRAGESGTLTAGTDVGSSVTAETGTDGVASCSWELDGTTESQQVTATLVDDLDQAPPHPIHFNASLSLASNVAYDPGTCVGLAGATTVQAAIDRLKQIVRLEVVAGDAQEVPAADAANLAPLVVRVVNDCGPVNEARVRFIATGGGTVDGTPVANGVSTVDVPTLQTVVGADGVARDGIAQVDWDLDAATPVQHVFATVVDVPGPAVLPDQPDVHEFIGKIEPTAGAGTEPGVHVRGVRIAGGGRSRTTGRCR